MIFIGWKKWFKKVGKAKKRRGRGRGCGSDPNPWQMELGKTTTQNKLKLPEPGYSDASTPRVKYLKVYLVMDREVESKKKRIMLIMI